jgi:predicted nucleic acid-binding protein
VSVLVDTPIWSLALRRRRADLSRHDRQIILALHELAHGGEVELLGLVRQEVLSGIRDENRFLDIRERLRVFTNTPVTSTDFEEAAMLSNRCRHSGIASSTVDMLICAVALRNGWQIFSPDRDFVHYAKAIPIRLFVFPTTTGSVQ